MRRSRITSLILALWALALASPGALAPAGAHPGATVFRIDVGVVTPIPILVPADYGKPITTVDIAAPAGFRLDTAEAPTGWQEARTADVVAFTGGTIPANDPGQVFTLRGAATTKGMLVFPITTHSPDGTVQHYAGGPATPDAGAVVYAGATPAVPGSGRFPWRTAAGGAIVTIGVVGTAVILLRRRRPPAASGPPAAG